MQRSYRLYLLCLKKKKYIPQFWFLKLSRSRYMLNNTIEPIIIITGHWNLIAPHFNIAISRCRSCAVSPESVCRIPATPSQCVQDSCHPQSVCTGFLPPPVSVYRIPATPSQYVHYSYHPPVSVCRISTVIKECIQDSLRSQAEYTWFLPSSGNVLAEVSTLF